MVNECGIPLSLSRILSLEPTTEMI